jgi:hypothetical protein
MVGMGSYGSRPEGRAVSSPSAKSIISLQLWESSSSYIPFSNTALISHSGRGGNARRRLIGRRFQYERREAEVRLNLRMSSSQSENSVGLHASPSPRCSVHLNPFQELSGLEQLIVAKFGPFAGAGPDDFFKF